MNETVQNERARLPAAYRRFSAQLNNFKLDLVFYLVAGFTRRIIYEINRAFNLLVSLFVQDVVIMSLTIYLRMN